MKGQPFMREKGKRPLENDLKNPKLFRLLYWHKVVLEELCSVENRKFRPGVQRGWLKRVGLFWCAQLGAGSLTVFPRAGWGEKSKRGKRHVCRLASGCSLSFPLVFCILGMYFQSHKELQVVIILSNSIVIIVDLCNASIQVATWVQVCGESG